MINPITPGEILAEEYLNPMGISPEAMAETIGVSSWIIDEIIRGGARHHAGFVRSVRCILRAVRALLARYPAGMRFQASCQRQCSRSSNLVGLVMSNEAPPSLSRLSVLACYAHPDDEGFASGGLLAMLAAGGARITLVCATNGDIGEISDPALATPENLWQVRKQELRNAMDITGISDVRFLDYRDSGMEGWDDNRHPNAYCNAGTETVVERLRGIIAEVNAHVVITHDPTGGYGHPDHKTMCAHATAAAERASDPDGATPLLYYVCFPRSVFQRMWQEMTDRGHHAALRR